MSNDKTPTITGLIDDRQVRSATAKVRLQLKYLPRDFDFNRIDEYQRYLSMRDDQKKAFVEGMSNDEFEFRVSLETARALGQDAADKRDGSITEEKSRDIRSDTNGKCRRSTDHQQVAAFPRSDPYLPLPVSGVLPAGQMHISAAKLSLIPA